MGWSCAAKAGDTMRAMSEACFKTSGIQNVWVQPDGVRYWFEASRVEHDDGAITGKVWRMLDDDRCKPSGSFRIEGDGKVSRAPKFLKAAAASAAQIEIHAAELRNGRLETYFWRTAWTAEATPEAIEAYVLAHLESYKPGGFNNVKGDRVAPMFRHAHIESLATGATIATWKAPMFWVIP